MKTQLVRFLTVLASSLAGAPYAAAADIRPTGELVHARFRATATLLQDGRLLIAGGSASPTTTASLEIYDPARGRFVAESWMTLSEPRENAVAAALPNGKVLIAGGNESVGSFSSLRSAEVFDPLTLQSTPIGPLAQRRYGATATVLVDGRVLIAGGEDSGDGGGPDGDPGAGTLAGAELYDPLDNRFTSAGSMGTPRTQASAALLTDGRVLIVGGYSDNAGTLASAEIYDPQSGQFQSAAPLPGTARGNATLTLLTDGRVLVAGGWGADGGSLGDAFLYDPAADAWVATGAMATARSGHGAALLPNGAVLIAGGRSGSYAAPTLVELFNPHTGTFSAAGNLQSRHVDATIGVLPSGRVLIAGGYVPPPGSGQGISLVAKAELFDAGGLVDGVAAGALGGARAGAMSTLLPNGEVLVAGGDDGSTALATAQVYRVDSDTFADVGAMAQARSAASLALLPSGKVLVAGGRDSAGQALAGIELYDSEARVFAPNPRPLLHARYGAGSAVLADGNVLIAGGRDGGGALASAEIHHWYGGAQQATGALATARSEAAVLTLPNGNVLFAGGLGASGVLASAELYDPAARSFVATGSLAVARRGASVALLPNGQVLIAGGRGADSAPLASAELYDPASGSFSAAAVMTTVRAEAGSLLLPSGEVLLVGGYDAAGQPLADTERYDSARGAFVAGPQLSAARARAAVALLDNGRVLIAGGENGSAALASSERLARYAAFEETPAAGLSRLTSVPVRLELPAALALQGRGLRGSNRFDANGIVSVSGSEGSSGGAASAASNFPLLRLQRLDNQQVIYQSPDSGSAWTDTGFDTPLLTRFDPLDPASRMAGVYRVSAIVNGVEGFASVLSLYWIEDEIFASGFDSP